MFGRLWLKDRIHFVTEFYTYEVMPKVLRHPFVPYRSVELLNISVLLGVTKLKVSGQRCLGAGGGSGRRR